MKDMLGWCYMALKKGISIVLVCCAVFGWWGVLYPQLALTQDTYRIVTEDGDVYTAEDDSEAKDSETVYREILNAESGRVRFRSRLWDYVTEWYGRFCEE